MALHIQGTADMSLPVTMETTPIQCMFSWLVNHEMESTAFLFMLHRLVLMEDICYRCIM